MTLKRILTGSFIILICVMMFINGYTKVTSSYCYADATTDQWTQVTTNSQLVEAFKYYCKSRDLTIEGSFADGVTTFTSNAFNGACQTLGIDVTALQAQIKYQTDGNTGLKFLFSTTGINAFNRIFAQFLQDNDISVGQNVDKVVYRGFLFYDTLGTSHLGWITTSQNTASNNLSDFVIGIGDYYLYDGIDAVDLYNNQHIFSVAVNLNNKSSVAEAVNSFDISVFRRTLDNPNAYYYGFGSNSVAHCVAGEDIVNGGLIVTKINGTNNYYLCTYAEVDTDNPYYLNTYNISSISRIYFINTNDTQDVNVVLNTNNNVINNNNYEGDTIINNNGDTNNYYPESDPDYDPYPDGGGTTTDPSNTGGGSGADDTDVTFPYFNFQLPEINWSLGDLSEKFPFSIPFDLIAFFTVLNAEPQAPAINADIPLGSWYTWHFEADFAQFDNYAVIIRNVEFIGFCVGLIYLTIRLVKG